MTGCYSSTRRSLRPSRSRPATAAAARGLDSLVSTVDITPDGKNVYVGVGPFTSYNRGGGLALFRVAQAEPGARPPACA